MFYDPELDDQDQNWVNKQRKTCKKIVTPVKSSALKSILKSTTETKSTENNSKDESKTIYADAVTDAILNCPCCMTTLCMDSQRHETFKTQYRAMFVSNCKINKEEQLKYPKEKIDSNAMSSKKFRKKKSNIPNFKSDKQCLSESKQEGQDYDIFKSVMCEICNTEVGVYEEKEEIYHFFNVLTSHS